MAWPRTAAPATLGCTPSSLSPGLNLPSAVRSPAEASTKCQPCLAARACRKPLYSRVASEALSRGGTLEMMTVSEEAISAIRSMFRPVISWGIRWAKSLVPARTTSALALRWRRARAMSPVCAPPRAHPPRQPTRVPPDPVGSTKLIHEASPILPAHTASLPAAVIESPATTNVVAFGSSCASKAVGEGRNVLWRTFQAEQCPKDCNECQRMQRPIVFHGHPPFAPA